MTAEKARDLSRSDGFRPFRVTTRDGRTFEAPASFNVMPSMGQLLIGVDYDPRTGVPGSAEHLNLDEIEHWEFLSSEPSAVAV